MWIPLTDSAPKNSCLMVVPRAHDAGYSMEDLDASEICNVFQEPEDFQHITALPVSAGGLVGFSHRLFHWDSTPDRGERPRVAIALGAADPAYKQTVFREPDSLLPMPPLGVRLSLAAGNVLRGPGSEQLLSSVERLELFSELFNRYAPELSESLVAEAHAARTSRYERLEYLESAPTMAEGDNEQQLSLFEAAVQRDPYSQPATVSISKELDPKSDPFEILMASGDKTDFWKRLCPWLHVCDESMVGLARQSVFPCVKDRGLKEFTLGLRDNLIRDGFFFVERGRLPWAVDLNGMAKGILELVSRGFPSICILMYDEPWVLAAQLEQLARVATGGNELSFDWAAFCVRAKQPHGARHNGVGRASDLAAPTSAPAGWPPHRDRGSNAAGLRGFRSDGSPRYTTFWVPLTDATPQSSCLHVVPRAGDPGYRAGDGWNSAIQNVFRRPEDFRRIRAVPLAAGGLLAFSHRIFHWGSAADPRAPAPRIAVAFPAVDPSFEAPLFPDPKAMRPMPPLEVRLGLAAAQVLVYAANEQHIINLSRLEICWSIFNMHADYFRSAFFESISETNTAQHERFIHAERQTKSYVL